VFDAFVQPRLRDLWGKERDNVNLSPDFDSLNILGVGLPTDGQRTVRLAQ